LRLGAAPFLLGHLASGIGHSQEAGALAHFESNVRPLLIDRCQKCHEGDEAKSGLRLDSRAAILAGGDSGPAVVPGKPDESLLIEAVRHSGALKMPPKARLTDAEIANLARWVEQGAPWPGAADAAEDRPAAPAGTLDADALAERAEHWAFQPIATRAPPDVRDADWPSNPIDRFLLAAMEAADVRPTRPADPHTLIRRLTFDLIGLPPTPVEVWAFVADERPDAYERLVDRLLASPHFGERWGRHWLDLVRYAETAGHEFDYDIPFAWRYRDYVVRALNADVPYERFVREHLAGDLDPEPRRDPATGADESILGTGFLMLGEGTHSPVDVREEQVRRIDNQIDVAGKAFLGLTLACARCHDHKFDPITQADYYALAGYLKSTRHQYAVLDPPSEALDTLRSLRDAIASTLPLEGGPGKGGDRTGVAHSLAPVDPSIDPQSASRHPRSILFEDFDRDTLAPWRAAGPAFEPPAPASVRVAADALIAVPAGVAHSARVSERLAGVLRSPTFTIEHDYIHYHAAGRGGRIHVVVDGFEKIREPIYGGLTVRVDHGDELRPIVQDVRMWRGQRAYIELADGAVADFTGATTTMAPADGFVSLDAVWFSDDPTPPRDAAGPPQSRRLADLDADAATTLRRFREVEATLPAPTLGLAAVDGTGEDERLLIRGNPRTPGPPIPRRFLTVLGHDVSREGEAPAEPSSHDPGSGRDVLTRALLDPRNPLPARVAVNRLWHHHFGRGLVPTPDDFGRMGQPPTHPELLDWLAAELVRSGWSLKHVHRLIVTSSAYRMASVPDSKADARDPANRLWHRREPRRLEAEALRDALLAVSGRLDPALGGPSIPPHLTEFMEGRGRPGASGPLDGAGRRSLYLNVRRNFLPPFWLAFDFPTPASCMGRRNVSNVPAQALMLLNDPFVHEQAALWARRARAESGPSADAVIDRLYAAAFARPPLDPERAVARAFLGDSPTDDDWTALAHALVNVKEFLFVP
jgi:cytochrome c553